MFDYNPWPTLIGIGVVVFVVGIAFGFVVSYILWR